MRKPDKHRHRGAIVQVWTGNSEAWKSAARSAGLTLAAWLRAVANERAGCPEEVPRKARKGAA